MRQVMLCLDIGSGTVDALHYATTPEGGPNPEPENCAKFVLPTPAARLRQRIEALTRQGRAIYLHGSNMGGGFYRAVKAHCAAGLDFAIHPEAAYALADDPARLEAIGVTVTPTAPEGAHPLHAADYDPGFWHGLLTLAGLEPPDMVLVAAQDHGAHPGASNRVGRFAMWKRMLRECDGRPESLLFETPPPELTRLVTLRRAIGRGLVADTGAAAVLGVLFDPEWRRRCDEEGVLVVNAGNSHFLGFLLYRGRVHGVYEHHTGMLAPADVAEDLERFRTGRLPNEWVLEQGGHGSLTLPTPAAAGDFAHAVVLGPRRRLALEALAGWPGGVSQPAPGGDMMLAGAFGLAHGYFLRREHGETCSAE